MKRFALLAILLSLAGLPVLAQHYEIYPVPQMQQPTHGSARIAGRVNIAAEPGIDCVTVDRARQVLADRGIETSVSQSVAEGVTNLLLGLNGSGNIADSEALSQGLDRDLFSRPKYDRHIVSLTSDAEGRAQLLVLGENTDAVFCGLATVEQMLDSGTDSLPCVRIYDFADLRSRGVIEGYYGVPYNAEVTKDLFRFMARYKMNTYMYGAKSDPYHTRYWDAPYPETITAEQQRIGYLSQDMLRDIVSEAHASKVNFIWAIHPGDAFVDSGCEDVIDRIMTKFQSMYDLGVRQFGVFVDDVGVPYDRPTQLFGAGRLAELQNRIDERWNQNASSPADMVKPLQYVPQLYAYSWTTPERAQTFFESLSETPSKIDIYITGAKVWSVPNSRDLALVSGWLGRELAWWWNYPCNDNDVTKLFPADMYTNFRDETHIDNDARMEPSLRGATTLIANPMQQGEASKIALFSLGDYAWNNAAFDNMLSWEASLAAVAGSRSGALRRVLPLLRYYDEDALGALVDSYKHSVDAGAPQPGPLVNELSDILASCLVLDELADSPSGSDRLFYEDIRPWLDKLEVMLQMTLCMLDGREASNSPDLDSDPSFQFEILTGMGEHISLGVRTAEPAARVLRPFIDWLKSQRK
ncbi:MAG: beta-N-acetylglucosaminidase domain-containing protein [Alistipes sp.]|nr:beta-N-acetylglucosaminidase domain-containing protein [Alistipes sp.]